MNRLKETSNLTFAKVWRSLLFVAPATPHTTGQCEGTSIAFLTALRQISENSQRGRVAVGRGFGVMYSRRLLRPASNMGPSVMDVM